MANVTSTPVTSAATLVSVVPASPMITALSPVTVPSRFIRVSPRRVRSPPVLSIVLLARRVPVVASNVWATKPSAVTAPLKVTSVPVTSPEAIIPVPLSEIFPPLVTNVPTVIAPSPVPPLVAAIVSIVRFALPVMLILLSVAIEKPPAPVKNSTSPLWSKVSSLSTPPLPAVVRGSIIMLLSARKMISVAEPKASRAPALTVSAPPPKAVVPPAKGSRLAPIAVSVITRSVGSSSKVPVLPIGAHVVA